jgi:hypothetical protein
MENNLMSIISQDTEELSKDEFKASLEAFMLDRLYVVIDQNPHSSRLSIVTVRPSPVEVMMSEDTLSIHDSYGTWCNLIPKSFDLSRHEMSFTVKCNDKRDKIKDRSGRFIRTFKFITPNNPAPRNAQILDYLWRKVYKELP